MSKRGEMIQADALAVLRRRRGPLSACDVLVKGSSRSALAALALTPQGWLCVGEESGCVLWEWLGGDAA